MTGDDGAPAAPQILDAILDRAPCGFLSFAEDGTVRLANTTLLEMLGYPRDQVVGRPVERMLAVGSRIFYQTHWFPMLRMQGRAEEIFMLLRTSTGEDVGVLVNAARREDGERVEFDCVFMRVRERQKYEDALLRARRAAEQAQAELEVRGRELERANLQLAEQNAELEAQQDQLMLQSAELEEATEELRSINEDLHARTEEAMQMRAAADEANRAKSSFLAMMSHELRTPLNAIAGYVQILEMGIHGPVTDAQKEALGRIARTEEHLLRLINEVLDIAKIESGRVEYLLEDVPVEEIVSGVAPMIEPQLANKGVAFASDVASGLLLRGDREKVQQILINLLGNAAKFTPAGGRVVVEAKRSPERPPRLLVRVIDDGIGIPPEKLEAIFQPFVQVDQASGKRVEGTGLGLAISRELARGMGGDLSAHSAPGRGSVFTLVLPLADPSSAPV
jgi:PAS domain S-box-containing protein